MIDLMEGLLMLNYSAFNSLFRMFDSAFYEWMIVLLGPIIIGFYTLGLSIVDFGYLIYLVIAGLAWSIKRVANPTEKNNKQWRSLDSKLDGTSAYIMAYIKFIGLCIIGAVALFISGYLLIPFTMIVCLFGFLMYKFDMAETPEYDSSMKPKSFGGFVIESFKFFKRYLMGVIGIIITMSAYFTLGVPACIVSAVVLLLIVFDIISIDLFKPIEFTNLSNISNNDTCGPKDGQAPVCNTEQQFGGGKQTGTRKHERIKWDELIDSITGKSHLKLMKQIKALHKNVYAN